MIGILALQGAVEEHAAMCRMLDVPVRPVKGPAELAGVDGLILPGGESTALRRLVVAAGLEEPVRERIADGLPVWGTCAGLILLCRGGIWECLDASVERNARGSQLHSRIVSGRVAGVAGEVPFVYIRAPRIIAVGDGVDVLARDGAGDVVAARQGQVLVSAFHPELSGHTGVHRLFTRMVEERRQWSSLWRT